MRIILLGIAGGAAVFVGVFLGVIASGATFQQRCARAFPSGGVEVERCVYDLSLGDRP